MLLRGKRAGRLYLESYKGNQLLDIITGQNAPTIVLGADTTNVDSRSVTSGGALTTWLSDLRPGQLISVWDFAGSGDIEFAVIDEVTSDTSFRTVAPIRNPHSSVLLAYTPVLFEMNEQRGCLAWGNAVEFDRGTFLHAGVGSLQVNGINLIGGRPFSTVPISRTPQIDVVEGSSYSRYALGMNTPAAPTLTAVAGGTKNMQGGTYSIRIVPARTATGGYNNPSPKTEVLIATGQRIQITFPAMDTTHGQDAWRVYVSLYTANQGVQGPWYYLQTITSTNLGGTGAGSTFIVEWNDGEVQGNDLLEFDNFAPPQCEWIASLGGNPVYISCFGRTGGSPGANIVPAKPRNIEGAMINLNIRLDPAHRIIGWQLAQGRLFLMTNNSLQIATLSNLSFAPITTRPFWKRGFHNPYSLVFVNGRLYGWTHNGPTRSALDGEEGSEEFEFGADVREITEGWDDGKVFVAHAPLDELVCYIHSADRINDDGYWTSLILPYSLAHEMWMPPIEISASDRDQVISGVATVKNRFYFNAGGRREGLTPGFTDWRTYEFNSVAPDTPNTVPYFAAWQYSDEGAEDRAKTIHAFRVTGRFQDADIAIYGEDEDGDIPDEPFENPSLSVSGDIDITSPTLKRGERQEVNLPELNLWTARIKGVWTGVAGDAPDRIDEVAVEVSTGKMRR